MLRLALAVMLCSPAHAGPSALADSCRSVVQAPGFVAPDGSKVALAGYATGRPLAVVVVKGHWCSVCLKQLRSLSRRLSEVRAAGGEVVGLSTEDAGTNAMLMKKHGLRLPILGEPSAALLERLGFWSPKMGHPIPGLVFLDRCGDVVRRRLGRRPGVSQDQLVIETLRELARAPARCAVKASGPTGTRDQGFASRRDSSASMISAKASGG